LHLVFRDGPPSGLPPIAKLIAHPLKKAATLRHRAKVLLCGLKRLLGYGVVGGVLRDIFRHALKRSTSLMLAVCLPRPAQQAPTASDCVSNPAKRLPDYAGVFLHLFR
jgi:hypothetical protein